MENSTALTVAGTSVRQVNGLYSLNDLHKASGGEAKHEPNQFSRLEQTQALIAEIKSADMRNCIETRRGNNGGTYACKELVIAYAAWISAAFHLKVIRVFLDAVQPVAPAIDYARINPAQKQDLREIVQAIVDAGIQKHAETWARFQKKFRVNKYEELPASLYEEARAYLIGKLPNGYAGEIVNEPVQTLPDMEHINQALALAGAAMPLVYKGIVDAVVRGQDWRLDRYMLSFAATAHADDVVSVKPIDRNAYVMPIERFHSAVDDMLFVDASTLAKLVSVCTARLSRMAARGQSALAT